MSKKKTPEHFRCRGCFEVFKIDDERMCSQCGTSYCDPCRRQCGHASEKSNDAEFEYMAQLARLNRPKGMLIPKNVSAADILAALPEKEIRGPDDDSPGHFSLYRGPYWSH